MITWDEAKIKIKCNREEIRQENIKYELALIEAIISASVFESTRILSDASITVRKLVVTQLREAGWNIEVISAGYIINVGEDNAKL